MKFEWDAAKARRNGVRHDVTFEEAASVFDDPFALTTTDPRHSTPDEERLLITGQSTSGRLIVVSFSERKEYIRLISARRATTAERATYEEGE